MDIDKLIEELEGAEEGSDKLNRKICFAVHGGPVGPDQARRTPKFTFSVDIALGLVPEGSVYNLVTDWGNYNAARVTTEESCPTCKRSHAEFQGLAESMPLAICIAALKARKEKE